jgi:hypothetical protein
MKKFKSLVFYFGLLLAMVGFNACQDEFEEINSGDNQETISANSATANLVRSASAKDAAVDDLVDNSSCFAIKFPYTVEVNGLEIIVDSFQDLRFLRELVKQYDDDDFDDLINIVFPITITYPDFSELTIANLAELRQLASECTATPDDSRIRCIAFVYPIKLFTFDINNQQTGSLEVGSDRQLRRFFSDLEDDTLVSIEFPIVLKKRDGTEIMVTTNEELAAAIESAKGLCTYDDDDDDDDDDFYDDDFYEDDDDCKDCTSNQLNEALLTCSFWYINELELNDVDDLEFQYTGYSFAFKEDGQVSVLFEGNEFSGTWAATGSASTLAMVINIPDLPELSTTWRVEEIDFDNGYKEIDLEFGEGNDLAFKSSCGAEPIACNPEDVVDYLQNCNWKISDMNGDFFEDLRIDFSNFNMHVYANGDVETVVDEGNWDLAGNIMVWNSLSATLANYIGEWAIIDCGPDRIKIQRGEEYLYLDKDCD